MSSLFCVQIIHLVHQNLFIFSESEHLHREAFDVRREQDSGVTQNRMEDGRIAVVVVLTAGEEFNYAEEHVLIASNI